MPHEQPPTEPAPMKQVGGLWCSDVLQGLPEYIAGDLPPESVAAVNEHLRGCDWCSQFGERYATVVQGLPKGLAAADAMSDAVAERLDLRLRDEVK